MSEPARRVFRVLTRTRSGYDGGVMYDVQLQAIATAGLLWSKTFTDAAQAQDYASTLGSDLARLTAPDFRRKYSIPSERVEKARP
ncbi:MAG: hypothetical protein ACRD0K_06000 [Egibacteraceae bacterium]